MMQARPPYEWLLFDADGTLFDFDRASREAFANTFTQLGLPHEPDYFRIYHEINLQVWRDFEAGRISQTELRTRRFASFFDAIGLTADASAFGAAYLGHLAAQTHLLDGAEEVVVELAVTTRLMIITNGLREVQRPRFASAPISRHFKDFVISAEVGAAKPDRLIFDEAFARMGHPPRAQVLIIGDSLTSDIRGGLDYGIDTCWYNPDGLPGKADLAPRYEIAHLSELPSIVRNR